MKKKKNSNKNNIEMSYIKYQILLSTLIFLLKIKHFIQYTCIRAANKWMVVCKRKIVLRKYCSETLLGYKNTLF